MSGDALLVLADGVFFRGKYFGAKGEAIGEVVFNTAMTGYQEILTDPSYKGQLVTMTYPQIGNCGVNEEDIESAGGIKAEGFIVKEACDIPSSWRSVSDISSYLRKHNIIGIEGIDTRALTTHLRNHGAQMGILSSQDMDPVSLHRKVTAHPGISAFDLVKEVTTADMYHWEKGTWKWRSADIQHSESSNPNDKEPGSAKEHAAVSMPQLPTKTVVVYDFGVKLNILRNLYDANFHISVVPVRTPAEAVLERDPDGILLSNGPGDPETVAYAVENTKKLIGKKPLFGICLGHQILGLALGGATYKLKFGHHGGNHPVKDVLTGAVEITSQNHNYCVDIKSLDGQVKLTHRNLYDGTEEGMQHVDLPIFSVQHHPEAGPGPHDSTHLFTRFRDVIEGSTL
jgi:carbamoyl-phosphate synthase small subunit